MDAPPHAVYIGEYKIIKPFIFWNREESKTFYMDIFMGELSSHHCSSLDSGEKKNLKFLLLGKSVQESRCRHLRTTDSVNESQIRDEKYLKFIFS